MAEIPYDLCVVGGGLFGSAAARHASANPALKVCVIGPQEPTIAEKGKREIFASHYDEGRITRFQDFDTACNILSKHSIERYGEIEKLSGIRFHNPVGCLFVGEKKGSLLYKVAQAASSCKSTFLDLSDQRDTFEKRYPYLHLEEENALLDEDGSGYISPRKLALAQKVVAELQGCDIIEGVVCRISPSIKGVHEIELEDKTLIKAKRVLISTGAFTNLKENAPFKPLALKRYRETVIMLNIECKAEIQRLSALPAIIIERDSGLEKHIGAYILPIIQYPDGKYYLKYGKLGYSEDDPLHSLEAVKAWYKSDGDVTVIDSHLKLIQRLIPNLKFTGISTLTCATCHTVSGLPYIDRVTPTITVAIGGCGKGAKFSDEVGRIAAHLATTGQWNSEMNRHQFRAVHQ